MKKITRLLTLLMITLAATISFAQSPKALVIGANHLTPDGFAFVILEDIPNGEVIYFTDREYDNGTNVFNTGEFIVAFTASSAITAGTVVFVKEVAANTLTATCSGGGTCGNLVLTGTFAIGSDGDEFYAYGDTDADPTNGVTEIYSVVYTGASTLPGGPMPAIQDPTGDYPTAIKVDGFPPVAPNRFEYVFSPASLRDGVSQANLENTANYLHAQANADLSTVLFTNLNLSGANPALTVTASPSSVLENSGNSITFTFTLSSAPVSDTNVFFNISGNATFNVDYNVSGATSFNGTTGFDTILAGNTTGSFTLTPIGETTLEPDETITITLTSGAGYDVGSPSVATGTILNDDAATITPLVAVTGTTHSGTEGFSFVTLDDIAGGTTVYFTERPFDNSSLSFSGTEGVMSWTSPGGGVLRGEVIVATESAPNTFTATCVSGTCGTVTIVSGTFDLASNGEAFFAYQDSDTDPNNGVTQVDAVLFTGTTTTPGGNIPAGENPSTVYLGSVVVDGFPAVAPGRTEYRFPPERAITVDQADFQNTSNWFNGAAAATLSTVPFADIIITTGPSVPIATLTVAPGTTVEDSGTPLVYTFTLDGPAPSSLTINFSVGGSATLTTDYTVSGADTFTATSGTVTIAMGATSAAVTVTPVVDAIVEPTENVDLMIASGTGYTAGSPNDASGDITNDDTSASDPLVAIMGKSHTVNDGFSFVAAQDIPAGSVIYFTDKEFDNTTLVFNAGEAVLQYTSPGGGQIDQGDVIVVSETGPNTFTVSCSDSSGNGCGTVLLVSGSFSIGSDGETMYAYEDSDSDPTNGVDDIYSVMFTGVAGSPGGNIPPTEDPSGIYLSALVVDGFPASQPIKTEYTPAARAIPVGMADFENPANYDHAFPNPPDLSTVPFANLSIVVTFTAPADLCIDAGVQAGLGGGAPTGGVYSGPGVTDDGNGMTYSFDPAAAGVGVHTITYTQGGNSASDDVEVFALPTVTFTAPADLCIDAGVQAGLGGGSPTGGVYSGTGVTDDGNGMTYSFDPAAAGIGTHTITYTFTDTNGCTNSASDDVEVFALPTVTFTAPADLCIDAGVQAGLGGGSPTGGVYSGPGVTDDGNGMTYSFDPAAAGVGTHTITYTFTDGNGCTGSASDDVEVFALPTVSFIAPADLCIDAGVQVGLGGGSPTGGVYSGAGVTDDGNGMTYSFDPAAAGAGTTTITYTFTDGNGCTNSASDDVVVFALPTVTFTALADLCLDAGVQAGLGGGTPSGGVYNGPGVTDDGNGMTYSFDPAVAGVGTHTLTYTFTDANGCTNSASDDVVVFDLPTVTFTALADLCIDAGVQTGLGGGSPSGGVYSGPGVTDDGNGMTYSFDPAVAGVGTHTLTYTFTDANGCTGSASDNVEVFDLPTVTFTAPPSPICPNTVLTGLGGGTPTGGVYSGPGVTDDGNGMTFTFDSGASGTGTHTITYTFTDANGCTNSASDNVTVEDTTPPVITCPANIVANNDPGQCSAVVNFAGSVTDNCAGATIAYSPASGTAFPVGTTTVTATATDASGNTATCTFTVTVNDTENPTISCPANITVNNDAGLCSAVVTFATPTTADNCPGATLTQTAGLPSGSAFPVGTTTNTFVVTDGSGNTATCSFDVTVIDAEDPTITCPADITVSNDPGICGAAVTYSVTDTDNCPGQTVMQTAGLPSGSTFPVGTTTNTFVVTDAAGNTATCSFDVTVNDTEPPTITCPADITVNNDPGLCSAVVDYEGGPVSITFSEFFPNGAGGPNCGSWNTFQSQLLAGLNYQSVTISGDNDPVGITMTDPVKVAQLADALRTNATVTIVDGPNTWRTGGCGSGSTELSVNQSICLCNNPGYSIRPCLTNGNWGGVNTATCGGPSQTMTVEFVHNVSLGPITGTDNCPGSTTVQTAGLPSGSAFPVGTTTNTFVVTDAAGNTATCSFDVTVVDNEPPVALCMDITVQLDANGMASIVPSQIDNGSTDNCGIASLAVSPSSFDCSNVGPNTVTLTVTDVNGNSSTCTATVTVEDNVPPVAMCVPDFTLPLDATGNASLTPMDIDNGSTDACGIASLSISPSTFDCSNVGPNTVTLTVTDVNGNVSTCTTVVTVVDVTPPQIACPPDVNASNDAGICGAIVSFPDAIAIDECGIMSVVQTMGLPSGSVFPVGTTTIEYTATDVNGNTNTCSFNITVTDDEPPVAVCQDITIQLDANGMAMITPSQLDGGSTDNCGIASLSVSQDTFDCSNVGPNNVVLTVTDIYGNSSTCTAVVTVEDVTPPVAVCMDITVELDVNGTVTVDPALVGGASTDACGIASLVLDNDTFTCADVGDNLVTLFVTDVNGNVSTCTAIITVEDNIAPDLVCMDITVELDENGFAEILPEDVIASNTDACGIFTSAVDIFEFSCDDIGAPITVTVFTIDVNGNISSCTAEVTVVDALAPVVTCPDDQTVDPGAGNLFYEVPDYWASGEATATDNCTDPLTVFSQDPAPGTLLGDGTYTVTLCATDEYGNEACCTFELTVESILGGADPANFGTLTLYPNPANNEIYLSNPKQIELEQVSIYDMTGRLVKTVSLEGMGAEKAIDISELASATYMFIINNEYGQMTKSIIKE